MVKYVFWDSDNTLINTAEFHWLKHFKTLKSLGLNLDDHHRDRVYSCNGHQNWQWMSKELGLDVAEESYLDMIDQWYLDHVSDLHIRSGVLEALQMFKLGGLKQAVVSNSRRRSLMAAHEAKNLVPYFRFIMAKEDYKGRKPDPEPYLKALERMNHELSADCDVRDCLVIEDDPKGVQSARSAGMHVIDRPPGEDNSNVFLQKCKQFLDQ